MRLSRALAVAAAPALVAAAAAAVELRPVVSASGFQPVQAVSTADGRLFAVSKEGRVRRVLPGGMGATLLDLTSEVDSGGESGLLSIAPHPTFADAGSAGEGLLWAYFTRRGTFVDVLARFRVPSGSDAVDPASRVELFTIPAGGCHHGGQLAFGPPEDGGRRYLYLTVGDHCGFASNAADWSKPDGKILRLDPSLQDSGSAYAVPPTNPFAGAGGLAALAWAQGLRNPWRASFDEEGALWIGDVGSDLVEEIDRIPAGTGGLDFGWPTMEGAGCRVAGCTPRGELPVAWYPTSEGCAIVGGFRYRGDDMPWLRGQYLFGDTCNRRLQALARNRDGAWAARSLATATGSLWGMGEDAEGEVLLATNDSSGAGGGLHRLAGAPDPLRIEHQPLGARGTTTPPARFRASGGASAPSWSVAGPPLPAGVTFAEGVLDTRTPTAFAPQPLTVIAEDAAGGRAESAHCLFRSGVPVPFRAESRESPTDLVSMRIEGVGLLSVTARVTVSAPAAGRCLDARLLFTSTEYGPRTRNLMVDGLPAGVSDVVVPFALDARGLVHVVLQPTRPGACDSDATRVEVLSWELEIVAPVTECHDHDGDGVLSIADLCAAFPDPSQADSDGDAVGDACESAAWGDVSPAGGGDGAVTVADVVAVLRAAVGLSALSSVEVLRANVVPFDTEDGMIVPRAGDAVVVDVADATVLLRVSVGLEDLARPR